MGASRSPAPPLQASIRLRDGRLLGYREAGPPDGFPVVYLHGAIGSPRWRTPRLDALIAAAGIRYVAVSRPGFGASDPSPGRMVADFARDVEDLADALGFERFSVVGVSAGAPYALACAWALGHRIVAAAAVSPLAPPSGPGGSRSLRYRVPSAAFGTPGAGRLLGAATLRALGARDAAASPAVLEDYRVCRRPWGFDPADVAAPVLVWHGAADPLVPAAHAVRLAAAIPGCAPLVERRAGHFFYGRRLEEIVAPLLPRPTRAGGG